MLYIYTYTYIYIYIFTVMIRVYGHAGFPSSTVVGPQRLQYAKCSLSFRGEGEQRPVLRHPQDRGLHDIRLDCFHKLEVLFLCVLRIKALPF